MLHLVKRIIPINEQTKNLRSSTKRSVGGQENVDISCFQLSLVAGQALNQFAESGGLNKTHPYSLPLQVWDSILMLLRNLNR